MTTDSKGTYRVSDGFPSGCCRRPIKLIPYTHRDSNEDLSGQCKGPVWLMLEAVRADGRDSSALYGAEVDTYRPVRETYQVGDGDLSS